ncbi:MAG: hypothetical protein ACRC8P_00590 [Spiroplasma sp.]
MSLHVQKLIRLIIIALYSALVFALKEALAILPNIEIVTFLLSFAALIFPLSMSISIPFIFNLCEILLRGIATWVILYLIVWPLLVLIIWAFKKLIKKYWWLFIIINSLWGFSFGTLDAFINLFLYGKSAFFLYWINGLAFDAVHGVSNIIVATILYKPVLHLWELRLKYYIVSFDLDENKKTEKQANLPVNSG